MIERDCTVAHEGQAFTASGAVVTDAYARVYVGRHLNPWWPMDGSREARILASGYSVRQPQGWIDRYAATDWHGNVVGELCEISSWRVPAGWASGWMYAYRLTLADGSGRTYTVRGSGPGMAAGGRRTKGGQ